MFIGAGGKCCTHLNMVIDEAKQKISHTYKKIFDKKIIH